MELKIILPGEARVKKNSQTISYIYKDKFGKLKIRMTSDGRFAPVTYYTKAYTAWAKDAMQALMVFKSRHSDIKFPLDGKYNLCCKFFSREDKVVDLSNLMEGIQDCLIGKSGICKDSVPGILYQILQDDSTRFIGSLDGTRHIYLPANEPYTEVTLSDFRW